MLAVVGTVPDPEIPVISGSALLEGHQLVVGDYRFPVNRGTPALLAAAIKVFEALELEQHAITAYLAGDVGLGDGSRALYAFLEKQLADANHGTICFHYLQPDVDWQYRILSAIRSMAESPIVIADAGFMYAAKMGGQADEYDLFTPDAGELAFLADEEAPHPFYTRGFILHEERKIPELIQRAYENQNAARYLLVKGQTDYIVRNAKILGSIDQPATEAMEAIGGTGDTVTGMVSALIANATEIDAASLLAASANRWAGCYANLTPASQVIDIINCIPEALERARSELYP